MPVIHSEIATKSQSLKQQLTAADTTPTLRVRDLNYAYPDGHQALTDVSLDIQEGEKIALVGPNGAGKSTLILNLNGILKGEGMVEVAGLKVEKQNMPVVRALVGMVFQNPDDQLFSPTVFEDVAFGPLHMGLPEADVSKRVQEALVQVGMSDYVNRQSYHLSMGEKKRIAIATVLAMRPKILILDEPSSGLDPRSRRQLINLLHKLPLTMLVSTHDMLMAKDLFPRMVIMDQGKVAADGFTEILFDDVTLLEAHGLERPQC
jgi:cobalt/nickel transport system ATP-binding protein